MISKKGIDNDHIRVNPSKEELKTLRDSGLSYAEIGKIFHIVEQEFRRFVLNTE